MRLAAAELRSHGHGQEAQEPAERAVEWFRARLAEGSRSERQRANLANALYVARRWDEARKLYEELAAEFPNQINYQGFLGTLAARRGERDAAVRISDGLTDLQQPLDFGRDKYWQACIASLLGERERAMALLQESYAEGRIYNLLPHNDIDLEPLRDYPPFQDFLRPKG